MKANVIFLAIAMLAFYRPADAKWRIDQSKFLKYINQRELSQVPTLGPCQYETLIDCQNAIKEYARQMGSPSFASMAECVECGSSGVSAAPPSHRDTSTGNQSQRLSEGQSGSAIRTRTIKAGQEAFDQNKKKLLMDLKERSLKPHDEIAKTRADFEKMDPAAIKSEKRLIAQRLAVPNPQCQAIVRSLRSKVPPLVPPQPRMFVQLQPGDVLLVGRAKTLTLNADLWANYYLRLFDKLSSWQWDSRASHTLIYLKEVKGVKLFLDDQLGEGPRIKTEDQVVERYGQRVIDVAQPLSRPDSDALWGVARKLGIKQITADMKKGNIPFSKGTNYGLYGNDKMVCSEASRFVLVETGLEIAESHSPIKKLLGIYFGPANFYSDEQPFLITPLEKLRKK
ncbi:MAG: hypothetical protein JXI33_07295 [Candidatus Aminicenantes bacterium]|nr:hypothetical protein [Candidatus Aminicenantes bacterium]